MMTTIDVPPLAILVIDDEVNIRKTLALCLESRGHHVVCAATAKETLAEAQRHHFDIAFLDLRLGADNGLDLITVLLAHCPWLKIVVITAHATIDVAVEGMKRGAVDFLAKPFTPAQIYALVLRLQQDRLLEQRIVTKRLGAANPDAELTSINPAVQRALFLARQVSASDATILIRGESGSGKGVLAKAIHSWSSRAGKPFGVIPCPSLSESLLESELFGHVKGAFTGAIRDHPGRIAMSDGGTLFLDEIGDLPLSLQPKLLRFIQEREYEHVGDVITHYANIRLITATNINLEKAVAEGKFREDLLYRLNVIQIELPPLRRRVEDIVPLAQRFLAFFAQENQSRVSGFSDEALALLRGYGWPGNIRELRNVIERATILSTAGRIEVDHLPAHLAMMAAEPALGELVPLEKIEELHIRRVLELTKSLEEAATVLGIDTATLWRRRKRYGI